MKNITIISAGAGSGKTTRLTKDMVDLLQQGTRAAGIIATTFTAKAAAELQERVRTTLLEKGMTNEANDLANALISTVHGLGVKLLRRFAFEAGISPKVEIIADEDGQILFNQSLSQVLTQEKVEQMNELCEALGFFKKDPEYDWRRVVKDLTDVARANNFDKTVLEKSKHLSFQSFLPFIEAKNEKKDFDNDLKNLLAQTIDALEGNSTDDTKVTKDAVQEYRQIARNLQKRPLQWHEWAKLGKVKTSKKSEEITADLRDLAQSHTQHPRFHADIEGFLSLLFDMATDALREYANYKKQRGLIDYTDMEVYINQLLDKPEVCDVLRGEVDLLMVDEFQDTSPIQLEIFLKLSHIAKKSIWVGDPKQSIYGFRGAEPRLMLAIIDELGGVQKEDILGDSWRSRADIVNATNAIFTKAFSDLPTEQIALFPKREEKNEFSPALLHWQLTYNVRDDKGKQKRQPASPWTENAIAESIQQVLASEKTYLLPKGAKETRLLRAGDIGVLCRSNADCLKMSEALNRIGIKSAIAQNGLLGTPEAVLIVACLRYILNRQDSLAVAEILLFAQQKPIEQILEHRLAFLAKINNPDEETEKVWRWALQDDALIARLHDLRKQTIELSSTEILNLILDDLDLRRIISTWGKAEQRMGNIDALRAFALQYEDSCNRLHSAASLGGFLLWLSDLHRKEKDAQSTGEGSDAVNVMTYHKSKGLEFGFTILHNLERGIKDDVWGMTIVAENEKIDLNDILGGRWLRFWVNPYADQFRGTLLEERIAESAAKAEKHQAARKEEARLLYVGITRARDYLVFPTTQYETKWLNMTFNGVENHPTLDGTSETPFEWQGKYLMIEVVENMFDENFAYAVRKEEDISFLPESVGKKDNFKPYKVDVFGYEENKIQAKKDAISYGQPLEWGEDAAPQQVQKIAVAMEKADNPTYPTTQRYEIAENLILRIDQSESLATEPFVAHSERFWQFLGSFSPKMVQKNYPIRYHLRNGQLLETDLDYWIETEKGEHILIQNSDYIGSSDPQRLQREAQRLAFTLALFREALGLPTAKVMVHFGLQEKVLGFVG